MSVIPKPKGLVKWAKSYFRLPPSTMTLFRFIGVYFEEIKNNTETTKSWIITPQSLTPQG